MDDAAQPDTHLISHLISHLLMLTCWLSERLQRVEEHRLHTLMELDHATRASLRARNHMLCAQPDH